MKVANKSLIFVFITILIDIIGMAVIIPVLPKLIEQLIGGDISEASKYGSLLLFTYAVMQFLFSPIVGGLSDQYGRRPVLLTSLLGMGLNYVLLIFAPTFGWLFLGRALSGISGASITTASAFIADVSPPEKRTQNFGLIGVAFGLGFIIGPLIGGLVAEISPRAPFVVSALLTFANLVYGYFVLPESLKPELRRKFEWKRANPISSIVNLKNHPIISQLAVSLALTYLAAHAVQSSWSYYTMYKFEWNEKMVGYSLGVIGVLVMLVQGVLLKVALKQFGQAKSIVIGMSSVIIGLVLFAFASQSWMMFVFCIPYCIGGISGPSLQGIMSAKTEPSRQGELQGALTGLMSLTSIFGPLVMLNLFNQFSGKDAIMEFPGIPFILGAILMVIALILVIPFLKTINKTSG